MGVEYALDRRRVIVPAVAFRAEISDVDDTSVLGEDDAFGGRCARREENQTDYKSKNCSNKP
jgi:hypothetical protein